MNHIDAQNGVERMIYVCYFFHVAYLKSCAPFHFGRLRILICQTQKRLGQIYPKDFAVRKPFCQHQRRSAKAAAGIKDSAVSKSARGKLFGALVAELHRHLLVPQRIASGKFFFTKYSFVRQRGSVHSNHYRGNAQALAPSHTPTRFKNYQKTSKSMSKGRSKSVGAQMAYLSTVIFLVGLNAGVTS